MAMMIGGLTCEIKIKVSGLDELKARKIRIFFARLAIKLAEWLLKKPIDITFEEKLKNL